MKTYYQIRSTTPPYAPHPEWTRPVGYRWQGAACDEWREWTIEADYAQPEGYDPETQRLELAEEQDAETATERKYYRAVDLTEEELAERAKENVPQKVVAVRLKLALTTVGLTEDAAEQFLSGLPEPKQTVARRLWIESPYISRNDPFILAAFSQIGITEEQGDQLFIAANGEIAPD